MKQEQPTVFSYLLSNWLSDGPVDSGKVVLGVMRLTTVYHIQGPGIAVYTLCDTLCAIEQIMFCLTHTVDC